MRRNFMKIIYFSYLNNTKFSKIHDLYSNVTVICNLKPTVSNENPFEDTTHVQHSSTHSTQQIRTHSTHQINAISAKLMQQHARTHTHTHTHTHTRTHA